MRLFLRHNPARDVELDEQRASEIDSITQQNVQRRVGDRHQNHIGSGRNLIRIIVKRLNDSKVDRRLGGDRRSGQIGRLHRGRLNDRNRD